jgi:hypothetical protein
MLAQRTGSSSTWHCGLMLTHYTGRECCSDTRSIRRRPCSGKRGSSDHRSEHVLVRRLAWVCSPTSLEPLCASECSLIGEQTRPAQYEDVASLRRRALMRPPPLEGPSPSLRKVGVHHARGRATRGRCCTLREGCVLAIPLETVDGRELHTNGIFWIEGLRMCWLDGQICSAHEEYPNHFAHSETPSAGRKGQAAAHE